MILNFHIIFDRIPLSKQNSPEWDASFCGITSGYICLPMFHTENAKQSERISDSSKKKEFASSRFSHTKGPFKNYKNKPNNFFGYD